MKLSFKIFFGICIPAIISCFIISLFLINQNMENNIEHENALIIKNMESLENRAQFSIDNKTKLTVNENSYKGRDVKIYFINDGEVEYATDELLIRQVKDFNNLVKNKYSVKNININNNYYIMVGTKVSDSSSLYFVENINFLYDIRNQMIKNCIIIVSIMTLLISLIAYIISKTLTKPLTNIQNEMKKLSKGDFNINLKEGHGEFGKLGHSFNEMSKELDKRNNSMIQLIDSKQMFIDNLAHEMNTPLTSIQGYAELLQKANLDEERRNKYLEYIQSESKRILDMYKKLLLLSYKKNSDMEIKKVDINNVFLEVSKTIKNKLEEKNINLIMNNQLDYLICDETLIIMCVLNLIKNAISVSENNSNVVVTAFKQNEKKYIQVIDNGKGISKEDINKIIEPFYRVDKVRSRKNGGAGLGLSICKSIVEMHNGSLKIESVLGKGSIFTLEFTEE